jgi:hypothetical protein
MRVVLCRYCWSLGPSVLKNIHKLPVEAGDFGNGGPARDLLGPHVNERIPETGPAHGETDEAVHVGCSAEPLAHLLVVLPGPG